LELSQRRAAAGEAKCTPSRQPGWAKATVILAVTIGISAGVALASTARRQAAA
jgi:hypothetical protein